MAENVITSAFESKTALICKFTFLFVSCIILMAAFTVEFGVFDMWN